MREVSLQTKNAREVAEPKGKDIVSNMLNPQLTMRSANPRARFLAFMPSHSHKVAESCISEATTRDAATCEKA